jgi:hypothetical protein
MLWHKIARKTGKILMSCNATTKPEAVSILGEGYVVSDVSWRLDVHKFRPIQTVVTDQVQTHKGRAPMLPEGRIGTATASRILGIPERKFRVLADKYKIKPKKLRYGARYVNSYTPLQVEALRKCL